MIVLRPEVEKLIEGYPRIRILRSSTMTSLPASLISARRGIARRSIASIASSVAGCRRRRTTPGVALENIREVGVERDKDELLFDCCGADDRIVGSGEAEFHDRHGIVAQLADGACVGGREILIQ
jgi:hypothetical protein